MNSLNQFTQLALRPSPEAADVLREHARYNEALPVADGIVVVLAENAKDYTGPGTNTYIVGDDRLWIIDPGPEDAVHVAAVLNAVAGRPVDGILVTHNHLDHSPAARPMKVAFDAPVYGFANLCPDLMAMTDEDVDLHFKADHELSGGEIVGDGRWRIEVLHTPGHFPNHLCYLLPEAETLFSGDHVMGWSTTVISPPLGNLGDYLDSLDLLEATNAARLLPSHGEPVHAAAKRIREVRDHRMMRHAQIEACLDKGTTNPSEIVAALYHGLTPRLVKAAQGCVEAHLEMLGVPSNRRPSITNVKPQTPKRAWR